MSAIPLLDPSRRAGRTGYRLKVKDAREIRAKVRWWLGTARDDTPQTIVGDVRHGRSPGDAALMPIGKYLELSTSHLTEAEATELGGAFIMGDLDNSPRVVAHDYGAWVNVPEPRRELDGGGRRGPALKPAQPRRLHQPRAGAGLRLDQLRPGRWHRPAAAGLRLVVRSVTSAVA